MHRCCLLAPLLALAVAQPALALSFGRVDRDNDGAISYPEARSGMDRMSRVHFDKCDRDGDGLVDGGEYGCLAGIYDTLYRNRGR